MQFDVVIVGLDRVGLPLGLVWADAGLSVAFIEPDESKRKPIEAGQVPFVEHGAEAVLKRVIGKKLFVTGDRAAISNARAVVITTGTPVDEYLTPQLLALTNVANEVLPYLHEGQHIILRGTVHPGTSERLRDFFAAKGLKVHVSFCPERVDQGNAIKELHDFPHLISSFTQEGRMFCADLFRRIRDQIVEVGVREAEMAILFTNTWRYISFAVANQFYLMSETSGVNLKEIYRAMTENYERGRSIPRPGFTAGPCLLKDTMQLSAFYSNNFNLGFAAMQVNEGLPAFCVEQIRQNHRIKGMKIGLLGMAFKADVDDIRDSLSFKLRKLLTFHGAEVLCTDEYVKSTEFLPLETVLEKADLFIVAAPHARYRTIEFPGGRAVFNIWNLDSAQQA